MECQTGPDGGMLHQENCDGSTQSSDSSDHTSYSAVEEFAVVATLPSGKSLELNFPQELPPGSSVVVETNAGQEFARVVSCLRIHYQPQTDYYQYPQEHGGYGYYHQHQPYGM
eukprot:TRINITY_DN815_c0_g1_i1.p1 TRINITY_DN815_c0_g1~~TRINITY_DN815_c0_g1_i1.p1  ORF type:complete len:131 (+),score=15.04 TRINITY_DN815_c0_g1_i1:56-394(+)